MVVTNKRGTVTVTPALVGAIVGILVASIVFIALKQIATADVLSGGQIDPQLTTSEMLDVLVNNPNCFGNADSGEYTPGKLSIAKLTTAEGLPSSDACMTYPNYAWGARVIKIPFDVDSNNNIISDHWIIPSTIENDPPVPFFIGTAPDTAAGERWVLFKQARKVVSVEDSSGDVEIATIELLLYSIGDVS